MSNSFTTQVGFLWVHFYKYILTFANGNYGNTRKVQLMHGKIACNFINHWDTHLSFELYCCYTFDLTDIRFSVFDSTALESSQGFLITPTHYLSFLCHPQLACHRRPSPPWQGRRSLRAPALPWGAPSWLLELPSWPWGLTLLPWARPSLQPPWSNKKGNSKSSYQDLRILKTNVKNVVIYPIPLLCKIQVRLGPSLSWLLLN